MAISRRHVLIGGGALGVAAAIPVASHLAWSSKTFTRADYEPNLPTAVDGEAAWMNWSGIQRATPKDIAFPKTGAEADLAQLIRDTALRVRPVGSGHSFSPLAPSEGLMVDVSAMEGLYAFDSATGLATFGAGTRLYHAAEELTARGRAFTNLPDIDVQTLAGMFSTGTHGTGATLTALHDYIHSFRLITASGDILDVSRESNPDLFLAGKVSLGALGIITQYTVNTVPAFNLHRRVSIEPVGPFLDRVEALGEAHRNFEFYYVPATGLVISIIHDLHEGETAPSDIPNDDDESLAGLKQLRDTFGWFPWLRQKIAKSAFPQGVIEDFSDASPALLATTRPIKFNEMEYHLPRENAMATLRTVIRMLDWKKSAFFPMEFRNIAPDEAWLSPFNGGPKSSIAIHAAVDEPYDYFFSEFEPVYRAVGGRPHWGKLNALQQADFQKLYPEFDRFNALRRDLDPTGKFLNAYLAGIFGEAFNA